MAAKKPDDDKTEAAVDEQTCAVNEAPEMGDAAGTPGYGYSPPVYGETVPGSYDVLALAEVMRHGEHVLVTDNYDDIRTVLRAYCGQFKDVRPPVVVPDPEPEPEPAVDDTEPEA